MMEIWVIERDDEYMEADHYRQDFEIMGYYSSEERANTLTTQLNNVSGNKLNCHGQLVYSYKKITIE